MTSPTVSTPFREAWTLDPEIVFLNHGSFGACPRAVLAKQAEYRARIEREPVLFLAREREPLVDDVRAALGAFLRAGPDDLVPVPNATTGVNAVVRSLALEPGDEILVTDHGYNACSNAVDFVTQRAGARTVVAAIPFPIASPDQVLEAVFAKLSPRTRLVLVDHVTSPTGLVLPVEPLVRALRERGIETLVDGAHAPGMLPLDLDRLGAAYYTGNCHKWICAPKGAAFLYVRPDLQDAVRPVVISHGANSARADRSRFQLEFNWVGTDDPTAFLCVAEALDVMESLVPGGWDEVRRRNHDLVVHGREVLCRALGIEAPAPVAMLGSLATVSLPDAEGDVAQDAFDVDPQQRRLFEEHRIEVPIHTWPAPPKRVLRISAQLYNAPADYEALARALTA